MTEPLASPAQAPLPAHVRRSRAIADDLVMGVVAVVVGATWLLLLERIGAALAGVEAALRARSILALWGGYGVGLMPCAMVLWLLARLGQRTGRWPPALIGGAATGAALSVVGRALTTGEWISRQSWAPALRWGLPAAGAVGALALGLVLFRPAARWGRRAAALATALSVALAAGNALALPGLYPAAHLALHAMTAICTVVAAFLWARSLLAARVLRHRVVALAAALLPLGAGAFAIRMDAVTRADLMLGSPRAAELLPRVTAAARTDFLRRELETLRVREARPRWEVPRGLWPAHPDYNVVLVVVDALRADAVPVLSSTGFSSRRDVPFLDRWLGGAFRFHNAYAQASQTRYSLPPLFRSAQPYEDPASVGDPLPERMAALGHRPLAVVPQYFLEPAAAESQRLLDGFEEVAVYESSRQDQLVPRARELFRANRDRPFFAWLHFYAAHAPFYAGPAHPVAGGGRRAYRRAVRWLDGDLARLDRALRETGLLDRTIVIFTADHGEPLGDHGQSGHGHTVFESDIHVPLAIRIPGRRGADVAAIAGNIDVVPTIFELLGAPPDAEHRGRSLVPLLADPSRPWADPHYVRSGDGKVHGIVAGGDKLVWDSRAGAFFRFDLRDDPEEVENRFDPDSPGDRALVSLLVRQNPALMKAELREDAVQSLLLRRLREVDPGAPGDSLSFLLRLVALRPGEESLSAAARIFERTQGRDVRLLVLRHLFVRDRARLDRLLVGHLRVLERSPREGELVAALARQRQPSFGTRWIAKRFAAIAEGEDLPSWRPWLELVLPWRKPAASFGPPLARMLGRAAQDPGLLALLLRNVGTVATGRLPAEIGAVTLAALEHPALDVRIAASQGAARVRGQALEAALRKRVVTPGLDPRERQALLRAIVALEERRAIPLVIELGADPVLTLDAVQLLRGLHDPAALPFLRDVGRTHRSLYVRRLAKRVAAGLE